MKTFFGFLNLLLCFELIIGPVIGNSGGFLISPAMAEDCPSGTQYDSTLNRCITSEQTAAVMNAVKNCNGDKECYKRNAEQGIKDAEAQGKVQKDLADKGGLMGSGMGMAAIAVPLVTVIGRLASKGVKCPATSGYLMLGGGIAAFAGEKIANSGHKKRLAQIKADWDKVLATSTDSTKSTSTSSASGTTKAMASEAQSQAFEMLARSEDSLASAAKTKTMTYGVAAAAFAGAAVIAGLEAFSPLPTGKVRCNEPPKTPDPANATSDAAAPGAGAPTTVPTTTPPASIPNNPPPFNGTDSYEPGGLSGETTLVKPFDKNLVNELEEVEDIASFATLASIGKNKYSSPSIDEYNKNKLIFANFPNSKEYLVQLKKVAVQMYYNLIPIAEAEAGMIPNIMATPLSRFIASSVFAVWSGMMSMHAMKQAKIAKSRAELLRKMKAEFNDASTAINSCSDTDRSNPAKPSCYCYTDAGQRNTSRTSSDVCIALFTGKSVDGTAGIYMASTDTSSSSCITSGGNADASCACRATNTCLKASVNGISGLDTGTFSLLNGATSGITALGNGTAGSAGVNGAASVANAVRLLDASNKKLASTAAGQKILAVKANLAEDLSNSLKAGAAGQSHPFADSNSSSPSSMSPSQAVAALQEELKKANTGITMANGGQTLAGPSSSAGAPADQMDLSFDNGTPTQASQVAEAMKQNLDYGDADIKGSDTNIFEVVSSRYQRSGMRRLFDTEGKTKADAPAKEEITP
jgi:hypothetical protein